MKFRLPAPISPSVDDHVVVGSVIRDLDVIGIESIVQIPE